MYGAQLNPMALQGGGQDIQSVIAALRNKLRGMPQVDTAGGMPQANMVSQPGMPPTAARMALPPWMQAEVDAGRMNYNDAFQRAFTNRAGFRNRAMAALGQGPRAEPVAAGPGADYGSDMVAKPIDGGDAAASLSDLGGRPVPAAPRAVTGPGLRAPQPLRPAMPLGPGFMPPEEPAPAVMPRQPLARRGRPVNYRGLVGRALGA